MSRALCDRNLQLIWFRAQFLPLSHRYSDVRFVTKSHGGDSSSHSWRRCCSGEHIDQLRWTNRSGSVSQLGTACIVHRDPLNHRCISELWSRDTNPDARAVRSRAQRRRHH